MMANSFGTSAATRNAELNITFKVGYRYRCTLRAAVTETAGDELGIITMRWHPQRPRQLSTREAADYRRGRHAFALELARITGVRVVVSDVATDEIGFIVPEPELPMNASKPN
jgi:hypothetical protein